MLLKTSTRSLGGVVIVDCSGKIVMGDETAFLRHQVKDLLNESRQIVLNLAEVNYLDSTGLGTWSACTPRLAAPAVSSSWRA